MSFSHINNRAIQILRERVFINHKTPEIRELVNELTLINTSKDKIFDLFLIRTGFMVGLKIMDFNDRELVILPNDFTKKLFRRFTNNDSRGPNVYNEILAKMEKHEIFVLWIKLPHDFGLKPNTPTVIKFVYRDSSSPMHIPLKDSLYDKKFLFSIPRFSLENIKDMGLKHSIFYIIQAPEDHELKYEIVTNEMITNSQIMPLKIEHGVYEEKKNKQFISIHIPALNEKTNFGMFYDVVPKKSERSFNTIILLMLASISILVSLVSTGIIPHDQIMLKQIFENTNTIFGGITTASLAIIGIFRSPIYHRLRYWFTIPIIISAIGFLLNIKSS